MFIWDQTKNGINVNGVVLMSHPETGQRWPSEAEALRWWQGSEFNPENQKEEAIENTAIELNVTSIDGALNAPEEMTKMEDIKITVNENTNVTVSGTLDIDDDTLYIPFRRDDGRTLDFALTVKNKQYNMVLNFPSMGRYLLDDQLLGQEYTDPMYHVKPMLVRVMRDTTQ